MVCRSNNQSHSQFLPKQHSRFLLTALSRSMSLCFGVSLGIWIPVLHQFLRDPYISSLQLVRRDESTLDSLAFHNLHKSYLDLAPHRLVCTTADRLPPS